MERDYVAQGVHCVHCVHCTQFVQGVQFVHIAHGVAHMAQRIGPLVHCAHIGWHCAHSWTQSWHIGWHCVHWRHCTQWTHCTQSWHMGWHCAQKLMMHG